MRNIRDSLAIGYACLAAWSDLLDRINVFPVADGDTGANLRVSLAPLREAGEEARELTARLARCAIGNSGNIAAAFFQEFCLAEVLPDLAAHAARGRESAWRAVADPCPGTMLTVFDGLAAELAGHLDGLPGPGLHARLRQALAEGERQVPALRRAGVVDAGALGMIVFFEGFISHLRGEAPDMSAIRDGFAGSLEVDRAFHPATAASSCVDTVIEAADCGLRERLAGLGDSVVVTQAGPSRLKVHLHTPDPERLRRQMSEEGRILQWSAHPIEQENAGLFAETQEQPAIHLMTDAAGSFPREWARRFRVTLLDSYITVDGDTRPESLHTPQSLYPRMRQGAKATTAQASTFERGQHYAGACQQFGPTLYLCTGSAFTGNVGVAMAWKKDSDAENLFEVIDTGAASGRLGLLALLTARYNLRAGSAEEVTAFARASMERCEEFIFIDQLKYLAASGRVSRAGGFFGDLFRVRPVVSPFRDGVRKVGVARDPSEQIDFALARLAQRFSPDSACAVLLQSTDNGDWLEAEVAPRVRNLLPGAEVLHAPLSLTAGVHLGPGVWSVACCPADEAWP